MADPTIERVAPTGNFAAEAFRSLLVHVQAADEAQPRLATAAALARRLDATLIGVGAAAIDPALFADSSGVGPIWIVALSDQVEADLKRAETLFESATAGLRTEWLRYEARPGDAMVELSREADLIIAGGSPPNRGDPTHWCDPALLFLKSGRPVLLVPERGGELRAEAVIVAWKDTREARRAVSDAIPFLRDAREVLVVEVCDRAAAESVQHRTRAVAKRLERHGVNARTKVVIAANDRVADELDAAASSIGADLLVAGGYGHSRVGEWLFGGLTHDLLRDPRRFVLFSH